MYLSIYQSTIDDLASYHLLSITCLASLDLSIINLHNFVSIIYLYIPYHCHLYQSLMSVSPSLYLLHTQHLSVAITM